MIDDGEALASAQKRVGELECELASVREHSADAESQIDRARQAIADLESQIEQARINDADLKAQLARSAANTEDVLRQLEGARVERLHLIERMEALADAPRSLLDRLLGRRRSPAPIPPHMAKARRRAARRHLRGRGLEIGALHSPMSVRRGVEVLYVDRLSTEDLRREYAEWSRAALVEVDVIDDGERLDKIEKESQDFIIASHMLEHCENPLGTMRQHLSKLKSGGVLFYIIPDRRGSFDAKRPLTPFEHLVRDDREGPEGSRWEHYVEFSRLANQSPEGQVESIARQMMEARSSIHFHVWEDSTFRTFLEGAADHLGQPFRIEQFELNHAEIIAVLRKVDAPGSMGREPVQ